MKYPHLLRNLFLATLLASGISCKDKATDAPDAGETRMETVIAIHDEVMPEMKTIGQLVGLLKPLADSTEAGKPYQAAMEDLQASYKSMMDWMQGFGDRFTYEEIMEGKPLTSQKKEWLEEEEIKVKAMRDEVMGSIERARELLKKQAQD